MARDFHNLDMLYDHPNDDGDVIPAVSLSQLQKEMLQWLGDAAVAW